GQDTDSPEARSSPERQNCVVAHSPTRTRAPPTGPKIIAAVSDPGTCSLVRNAKPATHIDTTPNAQSQTSSRHRKEKERQKRVPSEVLLRRASAGWSWTVARSRAPRPCSHASFFTSAPRAAPPIPAVRIPLTARTVSRWPPKA